MFKTAVPATADQNQSLQVDSSDRDQRASTPPVGWIGVDLDGTLAEFHHWEGIFRIGDPVPRMLERVKAWLLEGKDVRIFTARVSPGQSPFAIMTARLAIRHWCQRHLGQSLPATATKDFSMIELWDDRAIGIIRNTGIRADQVASGGA